METIGFANTFYTLWDVSTEIEYYTDLNGKHWPKCEKTHFHYIKNISTDLEKVKSLYPDLSIDEELRGKSLSWTKESEDLTPEILKFGKYHGKTIQKVSEIDFGYILWLIENANSFAVRGICYALPCVIEYFAEKIKSENELMVTYPEIKSGVNEVTFQNNPNHTGDQLLFITDNSRKLGEIPSTLNWVSVNAFTDKRKDWFLIGQAESKTVSGHIYRICRYKDSALFSVNDQNFDTIELARRNVEIQELANQHKLESYYEPTEFAKYKNMHFAKASAGEGNTIYVFFPVVQKKGGTYPYNMAVVGNTAMSVKNKRVTLKLKVFHTERTIHGVTQYAEEFVK